MLVVSMKQEHKHIVIIKNGRLEGIFTYAFPGGPILSWTFKEGVLNGAAIEYIEEGLSSCRYKMGIKTGKLQLQ